MNPGSIALLFGEAVLLVGGMLLYRYVKGIPDQIHERAQREFEHGLSQQLERLRADLQREIEILKISREQLQIYKIKEFVALADQYNEYLTDSTKVAQLTKDAKEKAKLKHFMIQMGTRLFFFAGDQAVRKYIEFRELGTRIERGEMTPEESVVLYGELMTEIRRDLGYEDTECGPEEFLRTIIIDWNGSTAQRLLAGNRNDA